MEGRDERHALAREQRGWEIIQVEVENIEIGREAVYLLQQQELWRETVPDRWVEAQSPRPDRHEFCLGYRITACEQGHIMTHGTQFFGQKENDAFGPAIKSGGNRFVQRGDLGNSHGLSGA